MMRPYFKAIFFLNVLYPSFIVAQTAGTLGTTTTGTVIVSISIPALVQITDLRDIILNSPTVFPATASTSACIYTNVGSPAGSYYVTAISANASGTSFRVHDSGTNFITYSAYWNNAASAQPTVILSSGVKTAQQIGGSAISTTCSGIDNANFNVSFSAEQVQGAAAATYTDTVTLLISPT